MHGFLYHCDHVNCNAQLWSVNVCICMQRRILTSTYLLYRCPQSFRPWLHVLCTCVLCTIVCFCFIRIPLQMQASLKRQERLRKNRESSCVSRKKRKMVSAIWQHLSATSAVTFNWNNWWLNVVEAQCYTLQCRRIDCEQLRSTIN